MTVVVVVVLVVLLTIGFLVAFGGMSRARVASSSATIAATIPPVPKPAPAAAPDREFLARLRSSTVASDGSWRCEVELVPASPRSWTQVTVSGGQVGYGPPWEQAELVVPPPAGPYEGSIALTFVCAPLARGPEESGAPRLHFDVTVAGVEASWSAAAQVALDPIPGG